MKGRKKVSLSATDSLAVRYRSRTSLLFVKN